MTPSQRRRQLATFGRGALVGVTVLFVLACLLGLYQLAYLVTHAETVMPRHSEPGIVVHPCDVANGDLVVHENRVYEVRVSAICDDQGGYLGTDVELWPPGEAGSAAGPVVRTTWGPGLRGFPDLRIRVIGRAK